MVEITVFVVPGTCVTVKMVGTSAFGGVTSKTDDGIHVLDFPDLSWHVTFIVYVVSASRPPMTYDVTGYVNESTRYFSSLDPPFNTTVQV